MTIKKIKYTNKTNIADLFLNSFCTVENGYVVSDGDRLESILENLSKVLDTFGLQLIDADFGCSDYVLKIEPKPLDTYPITDLDFHKKLLSRLTNDGIKGDVLHHHIQDIWDDAIKSVAVNNNEKKNTATDEYLDLFAEFIVQGVDIEGLVEAYKEDVFDRLYGLTDEELEKEEEFYEYKP
jgi:hypothetical protein